MPKKCKLDAACRDCAANMESGVRVIERLLRP